MHRRGKFILEKNGDSLNITKQQFPSTHQETGTKSHLHSPSAFWHGKTSLTCPGKPHPRAVAVNHLALGIFFKEICSSKMQSAAF